MIVADANVILYALTPGERTSSAREALEGADGVAVPRLWRLEIANALAVMVRRRLLTRKEATQAFAGALATFSSREHEVALDAALRIALESGLSAYDAEYVALARELGCDYSPTTDGSLVAAQDVAQPLVDRSSAAST